MCNLCDLPLQVKNRTEEMTRGSVQKSVVVLSRLPLYGQIQAVFSHPDLHFSGSYFFVFSSGFTFFRILLFCFLFWIFIFPGPTFQKVLEKRRMQFRIQHFA
jgi:hypothetical protein